MLETPGRSALQLPRTTRGDFYGFLFTSERIDGAIATPKGRVAMPGARMGQGAGAKQPRLMGLASRGSPIDPSPEVVYLVPNECVFVLLDFPKGGWWLSNSPKWIVFEDSSGNF